MARAILTHLGLPADARWARGRDPTLVYDDLESPWEGPADRAVKSIVWHRKALGGSDAV